MSWLVYNFFTHQHSLTAHACYWYNNSTCLSVRPSHAAKRLHLLSNSFTSYSFVNLVNFLTANRCHEIRTELPQTGALNILWGYKISRYFRFFRNIDDLTLFSAHASDVLRRIWVSFCENLLLRCKKQKLIKVTKKWTASILELLMQTRRRVQFS